VFWAQAPVAGQRADAESLYAAYSARDFDILGRTIDSRQTWDGHENAIHRLADAWKDRARDRQQPEWRANRVAFLVEAAAVVNRLDLAAAARLLTSARELLVLRPGLPGAENGILDDADRFEVAVYRRSLAILFTAPAAAHRYFQTIAPRLAAFRRSDAGRQLVARIDMVPVLLAEADTRPFVRDLGETAVAPAGVVPAGSGPILAVSLLRNQALTSLLKAFPATEGLPGDLAAEMAIRRGLLQHRLGRHDDALASLAAGMRLAADPAVRSWGFLFSARSYEALGRVDEAIAAYEQAVRSTWPQAQTAAVALSAALFLKGDRAQAEAWARIARTATRGDDPWWQYWYGDQRFSRALDTEIRTTLP
jgi:tetratricopeptide (TPR) repeat protein